MTIVNLTRIRMFVKDEAVLALNAKLHERVWRHLGLHWHVPTRQLAGPMSRCYNTDIGAPLWLQKSLGGRLPFATLAEIPAHKVSDDGETGIVDYRCPEELAPLFLEDRPARQHRELFTPTVQGTTFLTKDYCLGTANHGNFWIQQRALLAYWGGPERPAHFAQLRLMHDDYDFSSALLYTTQERNRVLGLVNFRNPGGDKHISIDMIRTGEFTAASVRLRLEIADPAAKAEIRGNRAIIQCGARTLTLHVIEAAFGKSTPALRIAREENHLAILVDLWKSPTPERIKWSDVGAAYLAFTFSIDDQDASAPEIKKEASRVALKWGELELTSATSVAEIKVQDAAFTESRAGRPVPSVRLA